MRDLNSIREVKDLNLIIVDVKKKKEKEKEPLYSFKLKRLCLLTTLPNFSAKDLIYQLPSPFVLNCI